MKNIVVCSSIFETNLVGGYHFPHQILEINNQSDKYRIWLLTEDFTGKGGQRNEKLNTFIRKVNYKYPSSLFPLTHFLHNWVYYRAVLRFQKEKKIEAIIFNQAAYGVFSRLLVPRKIKIIGIVHDTNSLELNRSCHFSMKAFLFHQLTKRPLETLANYILDFTIANSKNIRELILNKRRISPKRILLLYLSIDVLKIPFRPIEWSYSSEMTIKILFVKLSFVGGGLEDLIQALGLLPYHFQLTVVGPDALVKPKISGWIDSFTNIRLCYNGALNQSEVLSEMSTNHILCIPSRNEALGLANVEGLSSGISVVTTSVGGIPEVLDGGNCGWLAEPKNPYSLSEALRNCIESPSALRMKKSQYGRAYVEQLFSKEKMLENFTELLNTLFDA